MNQYLINFSWNCFIFRMPSKEEPQNFQSMYGILIKIRLVSKYLILGTDMISEKPDEVSRNTFILLGSGP